MAGPFDMTQQFPIAAVIDAIQKKAVYQNQMQQQQRQDLLQGIQGLAEGAQSIGDARRRMAAAMTMAQNPTIQSTLGAGQTVPGSGTVNAPANQQLTTGPNGQAVTPGMTAFGGSGVAPVQNTPAQVTPQLTPQQIAPLLGRQSTDYLGDIQKANNLARLQQVFAAKGNVVTPIVNADGSISYANTQVAPGSTVQRPVRMPAPGSGRGGSSGMTAGQRRIAQLQTQYANLQKQLASSFGPDREVIMQQMAPLKQQIDQGLGVPSTSPTAAATSGSPMTGTVPGGQSIDPQVKALLDQHGVRYSPANIAWAQQKLSQLSQNATDQQQ